MSTLDPKYPRNATELQYKRIMTNWRDLNRYGQARVTESTLQKIEDAGESIFRPFEDAEDSIIDSVIDFLHSTRGIVAMLIFLIVLGMCCGLCYFCKGCYHEHGVRQRLNNMQNQSNRPQQNHAPDKREVTTVV